MNKALKDLCGDFGHFDLEQFLQRIERPSSGLYKCRIVYDDKSRDVEFTPYVPKDIKTLKVVVNNKISYEHKYADRYKLEKLYAGKADCDDVLIIKKDMVTDTSYANIAFKKGNFWYTPWTTLLRGTMRQSLIERNVIRVETIRKEDIHSFDRFKLMNAMIGFDGPEIDVSNIVF